MLVLLIFFLQEQVSEANFVHCPFLSSLTSCTESKLCTAGDSGGQGTSLVSLSNDLGYVGERSERPGGAHNYGLLRAYKYT